LKKDTRKSISRVNVSKPVENTPTESLGFTVRYLRWITCLDRSCHCVKHLTPAAGITSWLWMTLRFVSLSTTSESGSHLKNPEACTIIMRLPGNSSLNFGEMFLSVQRR
jgi:hypothetical protein